MCRPKPHSPIHSFLFYSFNKHLDSSPDVRGKWRQTRPPERDSFKHDQWSLRVTLRLGEAARSQLSPFPVRPIVVLLFPPEMPPFLSCHPIDLNPIYHRDPLSSSSYRLSRRPVTLHWVSLLLLWSL